MTLHEKIERLHELGDVVLYRWMTGKHRIAKDFVVLSALRLEVLSCTKNKLFFSMSAPVLYMDRGRPRIVMRDRDVLSITSGKRAGMTIIPSVLQDGENAVEARYCKRMQVREDYCQKWLANKIMSIAGSSVYPVSRIIVPEMFRISKNPIVLKPFFTTGLLKDIGGTPNDSVDQLLQKFHANLSMFAKDTDDGWIINNDMIATGGCCIAAAKGITGSGSMVHMTTLRQFQTDVQSKHWVIGYSEETL